MSQHATPGNPHGPVDLIESLAFTHSADMSGDGVYVAWSASRIEAGEEIVELSLTNLQSGEMRSIGQGQDPVWSPDGSQFIYVVSDDSGADQFSRYTLSSGHTERVTALEQGVIGPVAWSPDGARVVFTAPPVAPDRSKPYRITRTVGWQDGIGLVDDATTNIWVLELDGGGTRQLTDDEWINASPTWLSQTGEIAFIATSGPENWEPMGLIRAVSMDGVVRTLVEVPEMLAIAEVPATIGQLVVMTPGMPQGSFGELLVLRHDGTFDNRTATLGIDIAGDVIGDMPIPYTDPDPWIPILDESAIVRVQKGDRLEIHRIGLGGGCSSELVLSAKGCVYPLTVAGDRLMYAQGDIVNAPDFWILDLTSRETRQISHTSEANAQALSALDVEDFWVQHGEGPDVQGKFLRPSGANHPLPTVLLIHGGPYSAFGQAFFADAQLLCEAGFGVLMVNPRGSRGYGKEFGLAINGDWGNKDFADLMAAVDHAVEAGWADPDRLGVAGLSYGGFMTAWAVGHTHRFKAAVFENGVTNLVSMYGTSDIGLSFMPEICQATPYEDLATYLRCSPISTADTVFTPTLIIVGDADHRCPAEQGKQLYSVLRRSGCETEMLVLPGAAHAGSISGTAAVRRAQNEGLLHWMERHV